MRYICLLRGINVGAKNRIKMDALRESFSVSGFSNPQTYIQSGNVVFDSDEASEQVLCERLVTMLQKHFGYAVPVMLRKLSEFELLIAQQPFQGAAFDPACMHVVFLSAELATDSTQKLEGLPAAPDLCRLGYREAYLYCPQGYARTVYSNQFFESCFGLQATTRNWKTVCAIYKMLQS